MIKYVTDCYSYYGMSINNSSIKSIACEYGDAIDVKAGKEELRCLLDSLRESFDGFSCYLYIETEIISAVQRRRGIWSKIGYDRTVMSEIVVQQPGNTICGIGEFPIGDLYFVTDILERFPFHSVGFIAEKNITSILHETLRQYNWHEVADVINEGCTFCKAVFVYICGNDGSSFNCFFSQDDEKPIIGCMKQHI